MYMGNLDERCTDALVWELMLQAGPVSACAPCSRACADEIVNVHLPKDRVSMSHQGYGFCEFGSEDDAEYACQIMNQIKLYGKPIRVNKVRFSHLLVSLHRSHGAGLLRPQAARHWREPLHREP